MPAGPHIKPIRVRDEGLRRAFITMLATQLALGFLGFLTSTIAARLLGPAGRGELAAVWSIPNLLAMLGGLGMGEAALYFAAKQPTATRSIVQESLRIACFGATGVFIVGVVLLHYVIEDPTTRLSAQLNMPVAFAVAVFAVCHQPLRALGYSRLWGTFRISIAGTWLLILLTAAIFDSHNIRGLTLTFVGAQVIVAVWATRLLHRYPDDEPPMWENFRLRLLRYGLPSSLITVPYVLNSRLDQVLMIGLVSRSNLGVYTAAVSFSLIAGFPFQALAKVTMPRVAAADDWRPIAVRLFLSTLLLVAVVLAVVLPLTGWLFPALMGSGFREGTTAARLLVAAATIRGAADILQETIRGLGQPSRAVVVETIGLTVGLVALLVLIGDHGVTGAAIASILGYGSTLLGHILLVGVAFVRRSSDSSDNTGNSPGPANQ